MQSTLIDDILINTFCFTGIAFVFGVLVWAAPKLYNDDFRWGTWLKTTWNLRRIDSFKSDDAPLILNTKELSDLANFFLNRMTKRSSLFDYLDSSATRLFIIRDSSNAVSDMDFLAAYQPENVKAAYEAAFTRYISNRAISQGYTTVPQIDLDRSIYRCFMHQSVGA